MDITYTMIGADGLHYGPVNLEQLKGWIAEGRIMPETKILRSDTQSWLPAANYVELELAAMPPPIAPPIRTVSAAGAASGVVPNYNPALERRANMGARWFFWIAGLALVNTVMSASGTGAGFVIGMLGISEIANGVVLRLGLGGNVMVAINVAFAALYGLFGFFAFRRQSWSYFLGGLFYALDTVVFVLAHSWIVVAFHVFVLFWVFLGLKANMQLKAQQR